MKTLRIFSSAVLAGMCIGLGAMVFLSLENRIVGAMLFTIGLFCVCSFGLNLFTGKVCYAPENGFKFACALPVIWLGNLVGTGVTALVVMFTRTDVIAAKASELCAVKLNDSLLSLFLLGVLCNIFIYIAVESFKSNPHELGKYIALFFGVMAFILTGTEHCVADMFYFHLSGWNPDALLRVFVITLGNSAGGIAIRSLHRFAS